MLEFRKPIPVIIKETKQEAYAIYAVSSGTFENDLWTVVVCDTSEILHCRTDQLLMYKNFTFGIKRGDDAQAVWERLQKPTEKPPWTQRGE